MKLAIFGATGGVGRQLVSQALAQGHVVTAVARSPEKLAPEKLGQSHERLRILQGDVLDEAVVRQAVEGQDVVLCALGAPLRNKEKLRTRGTQRIVRAMERAGVKRLVCLSGLGIGDSRAVLPLHYRYFILPVILRHVYADHAPQEACVRESGLDWIIVRPGNFTEGARTGSYRHGFTAADPAPKLKVSRADVADFMLRQVAEDTYLHRAPALSY